MSKPNRRQQRFAEEYLKDLNACQAAIRSGYSPKTARSQGHRLLTNADVQELIQQGADARSARTQIDADYVLEMSRELLERCMQKQPVLDTDGEPTGEWKFDSAGASRALKLLGDHTAINAFKVTDDDGRQIDLHWTTTIVHADYGTVRPDND